MKSQRECYEKLLDGKKLRLVGWRKEKFIELDKDGLLTDDRGGRTCWGFGSWGDWEVYEEPEKIEGLPSVSGLVSAYAKINELVKAVNKLMEEK
jgi:hypothetical protein